MAQVFGKLSQLFYKKSDTFGTPPAGDYAKLAYYSSTLAETGPLEDDPVLSTTGIWDPADQVEGVKDHAGQLAVPLCVNQIGHWLTLLLGAPDTTDDLNGDYTHVWKSGADPLPSGTAEISLAADRVHQHLGLMANVFSLSTAREGGYGRATFDFLGQKENLLGASAAGNPVAVPLDQLVGFTGSILVDDVAVGAVTQGDLSYTNSLTPEDTLNATGHQNGYDRGVPALTGNLTARYTNTTLYEMARDHTVFAAEFKWTKAANKSLSIKAGRCKMPRSGVEVNGPGGVQVPYSFTAAADAAEADGRMMVVTLKNQTASY